MDSVSRLTLTSRITYYVAWLLALVGAFVHFGLAAGLFRSIHLSQRNLFEGSMMLFVVSAVSALRALTSTKGS